MAEEGEIFRKGNKLLGPEEMEGEYDGEELRIEVRASPSHSTDSVNCSRNGFQVAGGPGGTTPSACHYGRSITRAGYAVARQSKFSSPRRATKTPTAAVHLASILAVFCHVADPTTGERRA